MFVHQITEILTSFHAHDAADHFDNKLVADIREAIGSYEPDCEIDDALLESLYEIFSARWRIICDNPHYDYTVVPKAPENKVWIDLAVMLAKSKKRNAVQILIPAFENMKNVITFDDIPSVNAIGELFLSENDKTIYSIRSLHILLQRYTGQSFPRNNMSRLNHPGRQSRDMQNRAQYKFALYNNNNKSVPKPVGLLELYRISTKKITIKNHGGKESNFWEELRQIIMPDWHLCGELQRERLPSLLKLVELYYQKKRGEITAGDFRIALLRFSKELGTDTVDDVNHLYGQIINPNSRYIYLVDVLLGLFADDDMDEPMRELVQWIYRQNCSLVSDEPALESLYVQLSIEDTGRFGIEALIARIKDLHANGDSILQRDIQETLLAVQSKSIIDVDLVNKIEELYRKRWHKIAGTDKDYTRVQNNTYNESWINLARDLKAAKLISKDYYCFLMPTLKDDQDKLVGALSSYPLSHYILSGDKTALILLDNCVEHYRRYGTFYNCNTHPTMPLTEEELLRIGFAHKKFHQYIYKARQVPDDPMLKRSTLMLIKELVNGSLYLSGLTIGGEYTHSSRVFSSLTPDEMMLLKRLMPHIILTSGVKLQDISNERASYSKVDLTTEDVILLKSALLNLNLRKKALLSISDLIDPEIFRDSGALSASESNEQMIYLLSNLSPALFEQLIGLLPDYVLINGLMLKEVRYEDIRHYVLPNGTKMQDVRCGVNEYKTIPFNTEEAQAFRVMIKHLIEIIDACDMNAVAALDDKLIIPKTESALAGIAYTRFYGYLKALPADEFQKLKQQKVLLYSRWKTVEEILKDVENAEDPFACIALAGKSFAKLLMDYLPEEIRFRPDLEESDGLMRDVLRDFRANSRRKILQDDYDRAVLKIQAIVFSIMQYDFIMAKVSLTEVSFGGFSNTVPTNVNAIFEELKHLLELKEPRQVVEGLKRVERDLLPPILTNIKGSWKWGMTFFSEDVPNPLETWLNLVLKNGGKNLFIDYYLHDQARILDVLLEQCGELSLHDDRQQVSQFIDNVLQLVMDEQKIFVTKHILINLALHQMIKKLSENARVKVHHALLETNEMAFDIHMFSRKWAENIGRRLDRLSTQKPDDAASVHAKWYGSKEKSIVTIDQRTKSRPVSSLTGSQKRDMIEGLRETDEASISISPKLRTVFSRLHQASCRHATMTLSQSEHVNSLGMFA